MRYILLIVVFISVLPTISKAATSTTYEYKQKDKVEEQNKYIARLTEDKRKVNLAIQNTKVLIDKSRNKRYLPQLYLRLAELYIEKSRIVYFLRKTEAGRSVKSLDQMESNALKKQAIEIYQRILENYPAFDERDKVLFFLAHEYRELGQIDEMIKQYKTIIKKYKGSSFVPESYLLLGDYFFNMQDLDMAQREYEAVLNYPKSAAVSIARYKLAWCYINNADFKKAIKLFEGSVTSAVSGKKTDIDTYKKVDIRLESLIDMAYCYGEAYKESSPQDALAYFQKYSWSRPVYTIVLEKLAQRYLIKKKWHHAAVIYRQLSELQHDVEKLLEYARNIFECVRETENFEDAGKDISIIVKALRKQKYSINISEEDKKKNLTDYELYARDIVTHLHNKARNAKSVAEFKRAADAYKLYLDFFKASPTYADMELNYAETLFSAKQYLEAGKQYEKLATRILNQKDQNNDRQNNQQSKSKEKILYSAVLSYYYTLKNKDDLNYYQVVYARGGLKATGKSFVSSFPNSKKVPDVRFNVAWITYDEGNYDEAIAEFSNFVDSYPKSKEAKSAIHLILDAFYLKEDFEGLLTYGQKIIHNNMIKKALRDEVQKIVSATESKVIYSHTLAALNDWEKGKKELSDLAEANISSALGEQALNALLVSSKEMGDLETLLSAGSKLIAEYPETSNAEDILGVLIDASIKAAQFRFLVEYLEKFAVILPTHANSVNFLYQAAHIREGFGQHAYANRDYKLILERLKKSSDMRRKIIFAMSKNALIMGNDDVAISILLDNRKYLSRLGKIKADAIVADLYLQNGNLKKALKYRKRAYSAYKPAFAKKDSQINPVMARMAYNAVNRLSKNYMAIKLKDQIDNKIVAKKAKLLEKIEKGYHEVIQYKTPEWALSACYGTYEINNEFANFLKSAPLPKKLTPEQQKQYIQIIDKKAQDYIEKAGQYQQTCLEQAHKLEICDPELAILFNKTDSSEKRYSSYAKPISSVEVRTNSFKDESLRALHSKLMKTPGDLNSMYTLTRLYLKKGDFRQSILMAQKTLDGIKDKSSNPMAASLHNIIGVVYLSSGDDTSARDAFKKALEINPDNIGAKINLAGLYDYYGHKEKAANLYNSLPDATVVDATTDLINQRARELYYARIKKNEKKNKTI